MRERVGVKTQLARSDESGALEKAVEILRGGGLVAFPTETVYGLGADAMNPEAVESVFVAKGRPSDNPLIVHVSDVAVAERFAAEIPAVARTLMKTFWPGPVTVVVERNDVVPDSVTAGLDTVGLRFPRHPATQRLLDLFGGGIVGPSANLSGAPSPTRAEHVVHDLDGRIDMVLDGGPTAIGLESTVVDCTVTPPAILRSGGVSREDIGRIVGDVQVPSEEMLARSPGTRHRHYSPRAKVTVIAQDDVGALMKMVRARRAEEKWMLICGEGPLRHADAGPVEKTIVMSADELAKSLYRLFRECDASGVSQIIVESVKESGIGSALMDRIHRAAGTVVHTKSH